MMPTLNAKGDYVLSESWSPRLGSIRHGDLVVATSPRNPKITVCKRVIALV